MKGERYGISLIKVEPWNDCRLLWEGKHIPPTTAKGLCVHCLCSNSKCKKDPRKKSSSLSSQGLLEAICWHERCKESTQPFTCVSNRERCPVALDITSQYFIMYLLHGHILYTWKNEGNQQVKVKNTEKVYLLCIFWSKPWKVKYPSLNSLSSYNALAELQESWTGEITQSSVWNKDYTDLCSSTHWYG